MALVANFKKGERLLNLSAFESYTGRFIFLDDILCAKDGVSLNEKDFETFDVYTAEED